MLSKRFTGFLAIAAIAGVTVFAADVDLKDVKCIVAPKAANASKSADFKDGKVYFCCGGCAGKFAKDSKPFETKANHQLVATKQYEQKGCPLSGGPVNPETAVEVGGVKVGFCCNNCKGKVESAEGDDQVKLVFAEKAFTKAFKKVETKVE